MNKWNSKAIVPAPDAQREKWRAWYSEWMLDQALRRVDEPDGIEISDKTLPADLGAQPAPVPGQIRLFAPITPGTAQHPRYAAVLAAEAGGRFLVVPFGRLALPATSWEWSTGRAAPPLRVLCLWNAVRLPASLLEKSWVVDRLSAEEQADGLVVYAAWRLKQPPAGMDPSRTGPPLIHPLDPRYDYLDEEWLWMNELVFGAGAQGAVLPETDSSLPMAAEEPDPFQTPPPADDDAS